VKTGIRSLPLILVVLLVCSCGYRNPNVYSGPSKAIYMTEWKNRTSELGLNSEIYRSLTRWFQKSSSITTIRDKDGADLILAGEIVSIELPSLSYNANNVASEVKVRLRVRYILKEIATNKIVLEAPNELWLQEYLVSNDSSVNSDNEAEALETIVDEISKKIYQRTVASLQNL
jgi:outer membrane lipopolysaccharide assembly protein LptE/RlpB